MGNKFPVAWKQITIISIPKNGKDRTNPDNYHPIALTWFLETNKQTSH